MNIISRLTLKHLLENKKRTIVTIMGIAISTALISAIILGVFSFFKFFGYIAVLTDGNVHGAFYELTKEQAHMLKEDDRVKYLGINDTDPVISGVRLKSGKEDRLRVGNITYADHDYLSMMVVSEYEGSLPTDASGISVEEQFLKDNGLDLKPGDTLSFETGNRYSYDENKKKVYWAGNYRSEEAFDVVSTDECRITAILHGNRPTKGFDIIRGMDEGYYPDAKNAVARVNLKNCDRTAIRQIKELASEAGISKYEYNSEYLLSVFAFEGSSGTYRAFFALMGIALCIVIMTSVVLIVNSIQMSLTERIRYLGMLSSVGATGRQKRLSIYFEGMVLGFIGIPLGILMGYIGTKVTLAVLGSRILEAEIIGGAEGMRGSIPVKCSLWVILAIVGCSLFTILISVLAPAIKAAKITPIDALRQTGTIRVKAEKLKVNPLIQKVFGYEGELAYKNSKRNGIKGTVITLSIAVSVILFLAINFFCESVQRANQFEFDLPCQIMVSCAYEDSDRLREELKAMDDVDSVFSGGMIEFMFKDKENRDYTIANTDIADKSFLTKDYPGVQINSMALVLTDDEVFKDMLADNGLSEDKYFGDSLKGVLLNNYFHEKGAKALFNEKIIGQSLRYDDPQGNPPAIEIGDFVKYDDDSFMFKMTPKQTVTVFVPVSVYYEHAAKFIPEDTLTFDLCVVTDSHDEVYQEIYELLESGGYRDYVCTDMADTLAVYKTITMLLKTPMYGFTILLTLIAVANIVNTISTGVLLRRKEFAMYRSVGMEQSGFKKMIHLETILYGLKALIFGVPVSLILSYLMYNSFDSALYAFNPDWFMYIIVIAAVFGIVGFSMLLSIHKIKDDSIIETLKEEM